MLKEKENKGITLIALVLTIIIVLILAGTLIARINNNGILSKTNLSVQKYNASKAEESLKLKLENIMAEYLNTNLKNLDNLHVDGYTTSISNNGRIVTLSDSKGTYKFLIDEKYNITNIDNVKLDTSKASSTNNDDKNAINEILKNNGKIIFDFSYTGNIQTFVTPITGYYLLETWGAQGGDADGIYLGGKGGYSVGKIKLNKNQKLYVTIGEAGDNLKTYSTEYKPTFNGGGPASSQTKQYFGTEGGGATSIQLTLEGNGELYNYNATKDTSVLIVAGGGGGASSSTINNDTTYGYGGAGGGITGISGINISKTRTSGKGGTQSNGGTCSVDGGYKPASYASFGKGAYADKEYSEYMQVSGGGGWYGGGTGTHSGGGGGSGYISTRLENSETIAGNESIPTHDGKSTMTGNSGNGYAKITLISIE